MGEMFRFLTLIRNLVRFLSLYPSATAVDLVFCGEE